MKVKESNKTIRLPIIKTDHNLFYYNNKTETFLSKSNSSKYLTKKDNSSKYKQIRMIYHRNKTNVNITKLYSTVRRKIMPSILSKNTENILLTKNNETIK
jgi:hypothetical protein